MSRRMDSFLATQLVVGVLLSCFLPPRAALSQTDFYKGKTINIISARRPGGLGDMRTRSVMSVLSKHIPGNPDVVTQYMPGAGGMKAANYTYRKARPDGLTITNISAAVIVGELLGQPGVQYEFEKFHYLGSGNSRSSYVLTSRKELGLDTIEKLRGPSGLRIGGQSVGHTVYYTARLFVWLLGLKAPTFVTGYSGPEMDLALLRGELDVRANVTDSVLKRNPDWVEKKMVDFHSVVEIPKGYRTRHPAFDQLPALATFAKTKLQRDVLTMFRLSRLTGSPYILPPGTPKDRVQTLQTAFRKLFKDPEFHKQWKRLVGDDPSPLTPDEVTEAIETLPKDPEVLAVFKRITGPGPLPPLK